MRFSSKIASVVLAVSLVIGTAMTAFAATTTPDDSVIAALKAANVPATYITQAKNYLSTVDLTEAQAATIKADIATATSTLKAAGTKDVTALSAAQKATVVNAINDAANSIGLTVAIEKQSNGSEVITAKKANGTTAVTFTSSEVKQTGANDLVLFAGVLLIVLSAGSVFVVRKGLKAQA